MSAQSGGCLFLDDTSTFWRLRSGAEPERSRSGAEPERATLPKVRGMHTDSGAGRGVNQANEAAKPQTYMIVPA